MIIQDAANPPTAGEPTGGVESRGPARAPEAAAPACLAFDYMDEEIEEAMIGGDLMAPAPWTTADSPDPAGLD